MDGQRTVAAMNADASGAGTQRLRRFVVGIYLLVGILTVLLLAGCGSLLYPNQDDEKTDTNLTVIACFFASCDNDISENNDSEDNKGKQNEVDRANSSNSGE